VVYETWVSLCYLVHSRHSLRGVEAPISISLNIALLVHLAQYASRRGSQCRHACLLSLCTCGSRSPFLQSVAYDGCILRSQHTTCLLRTNFHLPNLSSIPSFGPRISPCCRKIIWFSVSLLPSPLNYLFFEFGLGFTSSGFTGCNMTLFGSCCVFRWNP
jgi:hypothetical protein